MYTSSLPGPLRIRSSTRGRPRDPRSTTRGRTPDRTPSDPKYPDWDLRNRGWVPTHGSSFRVWTLNGTPFGTLVDTLGPPVVPGGPPPCIGGT